MKPRPATIDGFLTEKRKTAGLNAAPEADKRTLIRRLTLDLTGLPQKPEEVEAFVNDSSPNAWAKLVDRLLASPTYGEKWGRRWLDVARYADSNGMDENLAHGNAWRYRDYVIRSCNADKPFDRFVKEQIAGDLLTSGSDTERAEALTGTGFLVIGPKMLAEDDPMKMRRDIIDEQLDTVGQAFLGLTLGCARCHDHKFDAVSTREYYAVYGILDSSKFSFAGCEAKQQLRDLVPLISQQEWNHVVKPHQEKLAKLDAEIRANTAARPKYGKAVQAAFEKSRKVLSTGEIADGGDKRFRDAEIEVKSGEVIFLSITPLKNHGADTTLVEFEIAEMGGKERKWNATADLVDDLLAGNPPHTVQQHRE